MINRALFAKYNQCPKMAWLHWHKPELNKDHSKLPQINQEVIKIARGTFPQGITVPDLPGQYSSMIKITEQYIEAGHKVIYNGAFMFKEAFVRVDVMILNGEGCHIYDIKPSTKITRRHLMDLSLQYYILTNVMRQRVKAYITLVDKKYRRQGPLAIDQFIMSLDVTQDLPVVNKHRLRVMQRTLEGAEPNIEIGPHCDKGVLSIDCGFKFYCGGHIPEHSVFEISGMHKKDQYELYHEGIKSIFDIQDLTAFRMNQKVQIECLQKNLEIIHEGLIREFMKTFKEPLYFLDFEAFRCIIPPFDHTGPTTEIPFQYSLHILNGDLEHREFLAIAGHDPRRHLAERLLEDIPEGVQVVAYNMSYEKHIIRNLAALFPDLEKALLTIHDQLIDLQTPFEKKWYYNNQMKGKYSIKVVLPALFPDQPDLDYQLLSIQNGMMAMDMYATLHDQSKENVQLIRKALLDYCRLDTLAMVKIYEKLKTI